MKLPRHIPQLDALRGLAVLYVMLFHISKNVPSLHFDWLFHYGFTGVDLFFVLSGFLITGILLETRDHQRFFTNFYARRALRIWPLYYSLLVFVFVFLPIAQPQIKATIFEQSRPWQSFPFFLQNYLPKTVGFGPLEVTWTLAIEEQFYLIWPLIVWLIPRRRLKLVALAAIAVSTVLRFCVFHNLLFLETYTNALTRMDGLGLGAFLAIWIPESSTEKVKKAGKAMIAVALPCVLALVLLTTNYWALFTVVSIFYAGLVCLAINNRRIASWNFLKYTGKISYGLYLLHVPSFDVARDTHVRRFFSLSFSQTGSDIILVLVSFAIAYALSAASWHFLERNILKLKSLLELSAEREKTAPACRESCRLSLPRAEPDSSGVSSGTLRNRAVAQGDASIQVWLSANSGSKPGQS